MEEAIDKRPITKGSSLEVDACLRPLRRGCFNNLCNSCHCG
jgi:hypothetical protein